MQMRIFASQNRVRIIHSCLATRDLNTQGFKRYLSQVGCTEFFLKYPHIPQKIRLAPRKIYSFKTAPHPAANKFLMDFFVARCRQVRTFQALPREKTRKFFAARLMCSSPVWLSGAPREKEKTHRARKKRTP